MNQQQRHLEFFVLSYIPDIVRGEKLNVGLLAIERDGLSASFSDARFMPELEVLLPFDERADLEYLRATFKEIELAFRDPIKAIVVLNEMLGSFANTLSISDGRTVAFSGEPVAEVNRLAGIHLHP